MGPGRKSLLEPVGYLRILTSKYGKILQPEPVVYSTPTHHNAPGECK